MYFANFRRSGAYVIAAMAGLCLSGCMAYPQNGQSIGARDEPFPCAGATVYPGERIAIQARRDFGWVTIAETTTSSTPLEWESGTWYLWYADEVIVPTDCWQYAGWVFRSAEIRAVSLDGDVLGDRALFYFRGRVFANRVLGCLLGMGRLWAWTIDHRLWALIGHCRRRASA
jgi:hypothetical protein